MVALDVGGHGSPRGVAPTSQQSSDSPLSSVQRESQEVAALSSWAEIHTAARLLRVPPERLEGAVTRRATVSLGIGWEKGVPSSSARIACVNPVSPPGDTLRPGLPPPPCGERLGCQVLLG